MKGHCIHFFFPILLLAQLGCGRNSCDLPDTEKDPLDQAEPPSFRSNLPLVIIDTQGKNIPGGDKLTAKMQIIATDPNGTGSLNAATQNSPTLVYDGWIGIERRGASSGSFPKKQFSLETRTESGEDIDIQPLGLPPEEDWILHAPYSDKTLMRNFLAYWMSNEIGRWATRTVYVETFLNEESNPFIEDQYWGIYLFMEKIKRDKNRLNLSKLEPHHTEEQDISGGYIFNYDRARKNPDDCVYYPLNLSTSSCLRVIVPKIEDLTDIQRAWIEDFFGQFEEAIFGEEFADPENGYAKFIDMDSFIDYLLLHELYKNIDGLRHSAYFHKDRNGKLKAGPYWDCNLCMGNANYLDARNTSGWCLDIVSSRMTKSIPFWWKRLLADPIFSDKLTERWLSIREDTLTNERILTKIDETAKLLNEAQKRNFDRWPSMGVKIRFNSAPLARTYEEEVETLKQWLVDRLAWMDESIYTIAELGTV